jgi:twitching motility protein PilI
MSNRIALRDLQLRLAQRLETAESQSSAGWLAVEAADQGFLLPLVQSGEIFPWNPVQKVPYTQGWFSGVVNLRGGLYGVVDLYAFLYDKPAPGRNELSLRQSRFIAFNPGLDINCVLLVDRLSGLKGVQDFSGKVPSDPAEVNPPFFGANLVDAQGRAWQEIDLQRLVEDEHFLKVAANTEPM